MNSMVDAVTQRFTETDEFAAALLGGEFEYLRVHGQAFDATLRILKLGDVVVQQADDAAHISRAAISGTAAALIVPLQSSDHRLRINGTSVGESAALLAPGGAEFHAFCPAAYSWAALTLPQTLLEEWASLASQQLVGRPEANVLTLAAGPSVRLAGALAAATQLAEDMPEALAAPACAEGLALSLQDLVGEALTDDICARPRPRALREAHRVVRRAEEFLRGNLHRPIYRDELCDELGISLRKLHDAFAAVVAMSPHSYLKARRLTLARQALRDAGNEPALVKSIALSHGFWHLGHFAHDYRMLFGEAPSQTLAMNRQRHGPERREDIGATAGTRLTVDGDGPEFARSG